MPRYIVLLCFTLVFFLRTENLHANPAPQATYEDAFATKMYIPVSHLIRETSQAPAHIPAHVPVPLYDISNSSGPKSRLFCLPELDLTPDNFSAHPNCTWQKPGLFWGKWDLSPERGMAISCQLQAFATSQFVGNMWCSFLPPQAVHYLEGLPPVKIFCTQTCFNDRCDYNAYYTRDHRNHGPSVVLPRYETLCGANNTAGSFFTVAHEAGHSLLDRFFPTYSNRSPTMATELSKRAVHEAFADITAVLGSVYTLLSVCRDEGQVYNRGLQILKSVQESCLVHDQCSVCHRGPDTPTDNPQDFHGYSLKLTRAFCDAVHQQAYDEMGLLSAMTRNTQQLVKDLYNAQQAADPFQHLLRSLHNRKLSYWPPSSPTSNGLYSKHIPYAVYRETGHLHPYPF